MKTRIWFFLLFICLGIRCSTDSLPKFCTDPIGSDDVTINKLKNPYLTDFDFCCYNFCFLKDVTEVINDTTRYYASGCFQLYQPPSSGMSIIAKTFCADCTSGELIDMGEASCLGAVTSKPLSGYSASVSPMLHHGYVFKFPNNTYGRFFIDSWVLSGSEIIKMNIVRQYPF